MKLLHIHHVAIKPSSGVYRVKLEVWHVKIVHIARVHKGASVREG